MKCSNSPKKKKMVETGYTRTESYPIENMEKQNMEKKTSKQSKYANGIQE